jgi:hypothetical protein
MMDAITLNCGVENRRNKLFGNPQWNGIDFLEVAEDQMSLCVHFFGHVPENLTAENIRIEGGRRIRDIHAVTVKIDRAEDPELDDCLRVMLDRRGDFSIYRLCLIEKVAPATPDARTAYANGDEPTYRPLTGFDPRYACLDFSFKVDCPSDLDCKSAPDCPSEPQPAPEINYLAKDYASFRQLILDRLALTMPEWRERHVPDIGITLVELLAYTADHLSYYQDAVATEAYLDTARLRISVRRHALLVDYRMHEGNNARAWLTLHTDSDAPDLPADIYFITTFPELAAVTGKHIVKEVDLLPLPANRYEIYEPVLEAGATHIPIFKAHSEIKFYTWGDAECCLPRGATRATLLDQEPSLSGDGGSAEPQRILNHLKIGDVLIFEEVKGPTTGNPADADPAHRHTVRLIHVDHRAVDGLLQTLVVEIEWASEDALPFALCLSVRLPAPDCSRVNDISVARGNVILVDHGRTFDQELGTVGVKELIGECACDGSVVETSSVPEKFRPVLQYAPLTHRQPIAAGAPANSALQQDPYQALPQVWVTGTPAGADTQQAWSARRDLLASGRDPHFVAEIDDDGRAHLRFGDGDLGMLPPAGLRFSGRYRVGNGPAGNVAAEAIAYLVTGANAVSGADIRPRNPLPAKGGAVAESLMEAKLAAPHAFKRELQRAIIADDYASLTQQHARIQRASARLEWMGSWYEARVSIDPYGKEEADASLLADITGYLYRYRRMGHDLAVAPARYVPLQVGLHVCVLPDYLRGHVAAALALVFGNGRLRDGRLGYFHADRLSFGSSIYASEILAAAQAVEGVESVCITALQRYREPVNNELEQGVIKLAAWEIPQLDNDPSFPEHGKLTITLGGGR